MTPMNRRDALKTTLLAGGALVAAEGALAACSRGDREARGAGDTAAARAHRLLDADHERLADAVADTILPTTPASPGATAAGAGATMNLLATDCLEPEPQARVTRALRLVDDRSHARHDRPFLRLSPAERTGVLREIDAEAERAGPTHDYHELRELARRAYFTSEVGMTRALRWSMVPGHWSGCIPLAPGQPAWG